MVLLFTAAAFGLSGCEEAGQTVQPTSKAASAAIEKGLGADFASISEADPNSKPRDIEASDLPPANLTAQPIDF